MVTAIQKAPETWRTFDSKAIPSANIRSTSKTSHGRVDELVAAWVPDR